MSFRQFGGLQYAAKNNITSNNYNSSSNLLVTQNLGQPNSNINFLSDICGNLILKGNLNVNGNINLTSTFSLNNNPGQAGQVLVSSGVNSAPTWQTATSLNNSTSLTVKAFNTISDYRIKENVTLINENFTVDELIPVTYTNKITEKQDMGFIAHDIQEIFPFLVNGEKDGEEYQSINYIGLIPLLIKEVQNLKKEIKLLKEKEFI